MMREAVDAYGVEVVLPAEIASRLGVLATSKQIPPYAAMPLPEHPPKESRVQAPLNLAPFLSGQRVGLDVVDAA
jgi:hypothetical protein